MTDLEKCVLTFDSFKLNFAGHAASINNESHFMANYGMTLNIDQIYWLFSSAAQSIAAFIALLLTGYALVVNIMDNLERRDDTLAEVHLKLKGVYYFRLKLLAITGGTTIVLSLIMIFVNHYQNWLRTLLLIPSMIGILATVIIGVFFIIDMVDPKKYSKVATALLQAEEKETVKEETEVSRGEFMDSFIALESRLREIYTKARFKSTSTIQRDRSSVRMMDILTYLLRNDVLSKDEFQLLREIVKVRNLVAHGEQSKINRTWMTLLANCSDIVENIKQRVDSLLLDEDLRRIQRRIHNAENTLKSLKQTQSDLLEKCRAASDHDETDALRDELHKVERKILSTEEFIMRTKRKLDDETDRVRGTAEGSGLDIDRSLWGAVKVRS